MCQTLTALLQQRVAAQPERTAITKVVGDRVWQLNELPASLHHPV